MNRRLQDDDKILISVHALKQWQKIAHDDHSWLNRELMKRDYTGKSCPCLIDIDIERVLARARRQKR